MCRRSIRTIPDQAPYTSGRSPHPWIAHAPLFAHRLAFGVTARLAAQPRRRWRRRPEPGRLSPLPPAPIYDTPLAGVCPATVVVQTNWYPGGRPRLHLPAHRPRRHVDPEKLTYTGPLGNTGVQLEIRAGGPAIGFQQVTSILYQDDGILLGYVGTDEAIQNSEHQPTVAVFANYDQNPQAFLWGDPAWDFKSVAEIGKSDAPVLAFEGSTVPRRVRRARACSTKEQIDTSYQGGAGPLRGRGRPHRPAGFRDQRAVCLRARGPRVGQAGQVPARRRRVPGLPVRARRPSGQAARPTAPAWSCSSRCSSRHQVDYVDRPGAGQRRARRLRAPSSRAGFTLSAARPPMRPPSSSRWVSCSNGRQRHPRRRSTRPGHGPASTTWRRCSPRRARRSRQT